MNAAANPAPEADPHAAWLQRCFEARNRCDDDPDEDEGAERHHEEYCRLRDLILDTPAFTAEGALARTTLLADQSLVMEIEHRQIRPALDSALVLLRVSAWRHP